MSGLPLQRLNFMLTDGRESFQGKGTLNKYSKDWYLSENPVFVFIFLSYPKYLNPQSNTFFVFSIGKLIKHLLGEHNITAKRIG